MRATFQRGTEHTHSGRGFHGVTSVEVRLWLVGGAWRRVGGQHKNMTDGRGRVSVALPSGGCTETLE